MTDVPHKQLRHVFSVTSGATPDSGNADYWDGDIRWVTPEDVSSLDTYWLWDTRRKITQAGYKSCGTTSAPPGSIVLTKRAPIGQLAVLAQDACSNQGCFLLTPRGEVDSRFFYYWLSAQTTWLQVLGRGSTFMELSTDEVKSLNVPHPPGPRQQAIADYLDRETARLDALVAAKERLLGLLAEKRRALITRAVTRGLDPRAPLRDSGIPWLGKIPAHWQTPQLKFTSVSLQTGPFGSQLHAEDYVTGGTPVINPLHLNNGRIHSDDRVTVDEAAAERLAIHRLCLGDVVFARRGEMGRCGVVEAGNVGWLCGTGSLRSRLREDMIDPYYLALVFTETRISDVLTFMSVGSTMDNLNTEILGSCHVPMPSLVEQHAIVAHVARMAGALDTLRAATERTISVLTERRAALVAAAVTGKIRFINEEALCTSLA